MHVKKGPIPDEIFIRFHVNPLAFRIIYSSVTTNDRIQKFTNTGKFIRKWGSLGSASIDVTDASPPDQKLTAGFVSPFG
jgi:hypothetical protein